MPVGFETCYKQNTSSDSNCFPLASADSTYSSLTDVRHSVTMCRAQYDYEAQGEQELSFKSGNIIKILYEEDDVWWCGEFRGKKGMFPKDYVDKLWSLVSSPNLEPFLYN